MEYQEFRLEFLKKLEQLCSGEQVELSLFRGNNEVYRDTIVIRSRKDPQETSIFAKKYYEMYRKGMNLDALAEMALNERNRFKREPSVVRESALNYSALSYGPVQDRICFRLVNYDRNALFLRRCPYLPCLDLAIVFYLFEPSLFQSGILHLIDLEWMKRYGFTTSALWNCSVTNMMSRFPAIFRPIGEVTGKLRAAGCDSGNEEDKETESGLIVMTNEKNLFGASVLCYPNIIRAYADAHENNYFILPSSVHEVLLLADNGEFQKEELASIVRHVNQSEITPEIYLSDHVYYYDRNRGVIDLFGK